jgi:hypothetical protein
MLLFIHVADESTAVTIQNRTPATNQDEEVNAVASCFIRGGGT